MAELPAEEIRNTVEPAVITTGLVVESVDVTAAGKRRLVTVIVDLPAEEIGSATLDQVSAATHAVSEVMDETDLFGESPYILEVTTPGIDRPLTERSHWMRARTRLVEVSTDNGTQSGKLVAVDDEGLTLSSAGDNETAIGWDGVLSGRMIVDFGDKKSEKKRRKQAAQEEAAVRAAGEGE